MASFNMPPDLPGELHGPVTEAVRQGVALAKLDWEKGLSEEALDEVDRRIDSKIDKVKLWLAGVIIANLIPVGAFAYMFGEFTGRLETQLGDVAAAAPGAETERRLTEHEQDIRELQRYHREAQR